MSTVAMSNPATVEYLTSNYLTKSNPQMAAELGVTTGTVTGILQRLGLKRPTRSHKVRAIPGEIWMACPNHPGFRVSNMGRVANGDVLLVQTVNGRGYMQVKMYTTAGERKSERVHRLVASAFVPNPDSKPEVNHQDGDKSNNQATNLEWCTGGENVRHAVQNGLVARRHGVRHHMCKQNEETIHLICQRLRDGKSCPEVERELNLRQGYVSAIASKRIWKSISDMYF